MSVLLLIFGLLAFVSLVVIHEFGHFIVARRNGIEVEEFGIGFPPRAWSRKTKQGFLFSLNWLPIGGFVKLKGEHDADKTKGSFGAASFSAKVKVMLAGVGMNLIGAFVLFTILAWIGMPQLIDNQFTVASDTKIIRQDVLVGRVESGSPADKAGLKVQDKLVRIVDAKGKTHVIPSAEQLPPVTATLAGQKVQIEYQRQGQTKTTTATLFSKQHIQELQSKGKTAGYLGISPAEYSLQRSTWSAPIVGIGLIKQFTVATFQGLGTAVSALFHGDGHKASEQVAGPIGIFAVLKDGSILGFQFVLMIIAIISLTLAIMNVLPIPALDGGRLFVMLIARIIGKPLTEDVEDKVYGAGFLALMLLIVTVTIVDVRRFF